MDTSKEYIKMCEKAVEVQELWIATKADCYWSKRFKEVDFYMYSGGKIKDEPFQKNVIWLPRQDQLQGMVALKDVQDYTASAWANQFVAFINAEENLDILRGFSMEQLWLAFVMKKKFNKTWDGED